MKTSIACAVALFVATAASSQFYKYVDKDGKTVYSDQPPANIDSKQLRVQTGTSTPGPESKTAVEKEKEQEKAKKAQQDTAKKAEQTTARAQAEEERCNAARENYRVYEQGGRIVKRSQSGERECLDEKEIDAEREKARTAMESACKKS